jgi:SPP1 gp7 family putative phage head morphogenesis protein
MSLKTLSQVNIEKEEVDKLKSIIASYLYYLLYAPIVQAIEIEKPINNSFNILETAFREGKIYVEDNLIKGNFNSKISKELEKYGAKFLKLKKGYSIDVNILPFNIKSAILEYQATLRRNLEETLKAINGINLNDIEKMDFTNQYKEMVSDLDIKMKEQVKKSISITPNVSMQVKENIAKEFSENLKLYVKSFAEEEILKLRKEIEASYFTGLRRNAIAKIIQERYNASQKKAKFLAKQETGLLWASFTSNRYKEAGIKKFEWTPSNSKEPDPYHKELYGKIYSFDDLPVINDTTGERGLPKQRYGCNCGMRAVIEV